MHDGASADNMNDNKDNGKVKTDGNKLLACNSTEKPDNNSWYNQRKTVKVRYKCMQVHTRICRDLHSAHGCYIQS
jgi:hypothetical protein